MGYNLRKVLGGMEDRKIITDLVKKQQAEGKKEGIFQSLMGASNPVFKFLGSKGGSLLKNLLVKGGLKFAGPLGWLGSIALDTLVTQGLKKGTESFARAQGAGGDKEKIVSSHRYKGKEVAKDMREALGQVQASDAFSKEALALSAITDVVGEITPKITKEGFQKANIGSFKDIMDYEFQPSEWAKYGNEVTELMDEDSVLPYAKHGGKVPTISEYYNMQGKSLGGSNKLSLAEILGRK